MLAARASLRLSRASASGNHLPGAGVRCMSYLRKREALAEKIEGLAESVQQRKLVQRLEEGDCPSPPTFFQTYASPPRKSDPKVDRLTLESAGMSSEDFSICLDAAFATCCLHVESRIAALIGEGFYTIGPCGEELLAPIGTVLRQEDPAALHYRHVAAAVARQLKAGKSIDQVLLDRARGYTVSMQDPVTSGRHCAIGGGPSDFIVTSTLASQCPPAVGRGLGFALSHSLAEEPKFPKDSLSFVSVGDGSVNNAHFLAAVNTAEYAQARNFKCPVLFGVSDNDICISLHGFGWLGQFLQRLQMPVFECVGLNILDVKRVTQQASDYVRSKGRPALIVYRDLPRRFAHSGNDREDEYRTVTEIAKQQETAVIAGACHQAVDLGITDYASLHARYTDMMKRSLEAFREASTEPKNTSRQYLIDTNSAPLVEVEGGRKAEGKAKCGYSALEKFTKRARMTPKGDVMRKLMNVAIEEALAGYPEAVYIGEDVGYGGYYKVTDGLSDLYPNRVRDFPPDETSLVGAAIGFSQVGLLPILEIPYAKYLDCGADMFFEAIIMNWLSNNKSPNGMMIRLQGFGPGIFGGNFHTHNSLHMPPGLDVVCYSNGQDYARGWRYAMEQAKEGRIVMSVDCTDLLNRRHVDTDAKDGLLMEKYPMEGFLPFSDVIVRDPLGKRVDASDIPEGAVGVVTYGTGVAEALRAQRKATGGDLEGFYIIDTPLLSDVPQQLAEEVLPKLSAVLFADVCKDGQHPYATTVTRLQSKRLLPSNWECISATPSYNPLGTTLTFTNTDDIIQGLEKLHRNQSNNNALRSRGVANAAERFAEEQQ